MPLFSGNKLPVLSLGSHSSPPPGYIAELGLTVTPGNRLDICPMSGQTKHPFPLLQKKTCDLSGPMRPLVEPWEDSQSGQTRKGEGTVWGDAKVSEDAQSCPTLCDPMDYSLPGSSIHGIFQARMLEWVAMPSSRGTSQPRDQTHISCIAGRFLTTEPPGQTNK